MDKIKDEVINFYKKISKGEIKTDIDPLKLYSSLGYETDLIKQLPSDINLGLSCGNPFLYLNLKKGETLLDLGSGTGLDCFITRLKFKDAGTIYGVDRLQEMIDKANAAKEKKNFKDIEFRLGELVNLPFDNESIDKIISNCVINLECNKKKVYEEIYRVLKKDGVFIISDISLKKPLSEELLSRDNLYGT